MKRKHILSLILLLFAYNLPIYAQDDGQAPVIMPVDPSENYYEGSAITLSTIIMDQSKLSTTLLYYKFSGDDGYTATPLIFDVDYAAEIPFQDVKAGNLYYYFLSKDIYGNQSTWPQNGEDDPAVLRIHTVKGSYFADDEFVVSLVNPDPEEELDDPSQIIVISIFDPNKRTKVENIRLIIDDEDVTLKSILSTDMVTYVPTKSFTNGTHKINFKLMEKDQVAYASSFEFKINLDKGGKKVALKDKNVSVKDMLNLKVNLGVDSDFDTFSGKEQPDNRPIDSHKLNASVKAKIWRIKFNASALLNTHLIDENATELDERRQPLDRLKVDMRSGLLDVMYGDYSPEFSELTLKGTRIRGISTRLKIPLWIFGKWNTSYVKGESKQLINSITAVNSDSTSWSPLIDENGDSTFVQHIKGTATRQIEGLRTELDLFHHLNFGVGGFRSYDEISSLNLPYGQLEDKYTFLGNIVAGVDATLHFNHDRTILRGELAISGLNDISASDSLLTDPEEGAGLDSTLLANLADVLGYPITDDLILGSAEGRGLSIPFPDMDNLDPVSFLVDDVIRNGTYRVEFMSPIPFFFTTIDVKAEYKRVPANFVSLGNASIQTDIQGLKSSARMRLFKNRLTFSGAYENKNDNVAGNTKPQTTNTITTVGGVGLNISFLPTINYSIRTMTRIGSLPEDIEELEEPSSITLNDNTTITHTLTPSYRFNLFDTDFTLNGNLMQMDYSDLNSTDSLNNDFLTDSYIGSFSMTLPQSLALSFGYGQSMTTPDDLTQSNTVFTITSGKVSYKFLNKTVNAFVGFNLVQGFKDKNDYWDNGEEFVDMNDDNTYNTGEIFTDLVEIDNQKFTLKLGAQIKMKKNMSIGITMDQVNVLDRLDSEKDYSELRAKVKLKMWF